MMATRVLIKFKQIKTKNKEQIETWGNNKETT